MLSLDVLRAMAEVGGIEPLAALAGRCTAACSDARVLEAAILAQTTIRRLGEWHGQRFAEEATPALEAGARRLALGLGKAVALALLCEHAQWALDQEGDARPAEAASRLAAEGFGRLIDPAPASSRLLAMEEPA